LRLLLSHGPTRLFRNQVGSLRDDRGRWVQFGLAVGSGDLIGWQTYTITPDDAGRKVAVFVSLEAKSDRGRTTVEQELWLSTVCEAGGVAGIVRTVDGARAVLNSYRPR
jgi:hypothetical protein